ncbi:hypothetical protein NL676_031346 [Syzygium grande]|nr:hypothetical protein NL676_031346 [Syzygium grande]
MWTLIWRVRGKKRSSYHDRFSRKLPRPTFNQNRWSTSRRPRRGSRKATSKRLPIGRRQVCEWPCASVLLTWTRFQTTTTTRAFPSSVPVTVLGALSFIPFQGRFCTRLTDD